jgi:anti-sigma factor RsiW
MPGCDQVKLLLGPFDDGELEPHEMEDVALHVVSCEPCKTALDEYRSLGVALRDCLPQPSIEGFSTAVLKRMEKNPRLLWTRWRYYLGSAGERLSGAIPLMAAGAFAALLTAWLLTPFAHHLLNYSSSPAQMALSSPSLTGSAQPTPGGAQNAAPDQSGSPVLALSNDPTTTVIWVPNQP